MARLRLGSASLNRRASSSVVPAGLKNKVILKPDRISIVTRQALKHVVTTKSLGKKARPF